MNRLDGKIAFLSGGARGIGAETARLMVEAGARVVIADILDERGRETARALEAAGGNALYVHLDVTRAADWTAAVAAAVARFGGIDILVNNAGIFIGKGIEESTFDDWERLCAVNLTGVLLGTPAALAAVRALRGRAAASPQGGAIVNLSSIVGIVGSSLAPLYSLTKGGVALFTKSLALEFARKGYRIRVNAIHPGIIDDEMGGQAIASRARITGADDMEAARAASAAGHPLGWFGTVTDIAKGIIFLVSDDASFMTGASLVVDGGWTAQWTAAARGGARGPRVGRRCRAAPSPALSRKRERERDGAAPGRHQKKTYEQPENPACRNLARRCLPKAAVTSGGAGVERGSQGGRRGCRRRAGAGRGVVPKVRARGLSGAGGRADAGESPAGGAHDRGRGWACRACHDGRHGRGRRGGALRPGDGGGRERAGRSRRLQRRQQQSA